MNLAEGRPSAATQPWLLGALTAGMMASSILLVALQQPLLAIAVPMAALFGLAVLGRPDLLIPVAFFVLFTNAAVIATHFHGAPAVFGVAPMVFLAVPALRDVVLRGHKIVVTPTLVWFFCFFTIQVVGAFLAVKPRLAVEGLVPWIVEGLVLYLLVTNAVRTPRQLRTAIWGLLMAGGFIGGISAYQQITGSFDSEFLGFAQVSDASFSADGVEDLQPRLAGQIGEKNRYAQVMAILLPLAVFQYWSERSRRLRVLALASLLLTGIGFALAFSRGAAVGVGLAFLVLVAMGYVRWSHLVLVVLAALVIGLVVPQYSARLESLVEVAKAITRPGGAGVGNTDGATRGRLTAMRSSALAFAEHPVVGVGPDMAGVHYRHYAEIVGGRISRLERRAHSLYLGLAAEHGLLGLLAFGAILLTTFRGLNRARRRWRENRPDLEKMATGIEAALIAYLTNSIFLHFAFIRYFWLVMGLAGAAIYMARTPAADASETTLSGGVGDEGPPHFTGLPST